MRSKCEKTCGVDRAGGNATYTSKMAVVEFVDALGTWVEETLLKLIRHPFFSIMADECTNVTTIEELTICCHWVESGVPEENFIEILPLKKANDESIYSALVKYGREKNIQLGVFIGMGYDADATSSGLEFVCNQISTYNLSGHTWHASVYNLQAPQTSPSASIERTALSISSISIQKHNMYGNFYYILDDF